MSQLESTAMSPEVTQGLIRHALTILGGYFVSNGLIDENTATTIVGGAVALVGVLWSVWAKKTV